MVNRGATTWTDQIRADFAKAVFTAFCGQAPAAAVAGPFVDGLVRTVMH
jgi:hypothetical protein